MPANALVQTRIDPEIRAKAAEVLNEIGITVSEAVRILLTRTANEGALPFTLTKEAEAHDRWFRAKVQGALDDPCPAIPHLKVVARSKKREAALQQRLGTGSVALHGS